MCGLTGKSLKGQISEYQNSSLKSEEIESVRKTLFPEFRRAKAEGKRAGIVRDKLIIEGQVFNRA